MSSSPSLVAIDWGSSKFRAFLLNGDGVLLEQVENNNGVFFVNARSFENTLYDACKSWLSRNRELPILMSGMIGSRAGWIETPYIPSPTSIHSLANNIVKSPDIHSHPTYIVPGVTARSSSGDPDVMRGRRNPGFRRVGRPTGRHGLGLHTRHAQQVDSGRKSRNFQLFNIHDR